MKNILVLGTGSWGTAISQVLENNKIALYGVDDSEIKDINENHINSKYFPIMSKLNENIKAFNSINNALNYLGNNLDIIIVAVPTNAVTEALSALKKEIKASSNKDLIFINLSKGYDINSNSMYELFRKEFPEENYYYYSLLGPTHAEEVISKKLTCINLVPEKKAYISSLVDLFTNDYFKVHVLYDLKGAEFYSSVKNVYALMSGILTGLGYGQNARAALLTYSLYEMKRLGELFGFSSDTLFGLCGIGDLTVTCYSPDSRNYMAGIKIGELNSYSEFIKDNKKTVEGIRACNFIYEKMDKKGLDLIIIRTLYNMINNLYTPEAGVKRMFDLFNQLN